MEEVQERRQEQDLQVPPGSTILPGVQQKCDCGKYIWQGGIFLLQSLEEYVIIIEEQQKRFANLFFGKLLQNLVNKSYKSKFELKQFKEAQDRIRGLKLRMQKNNMEKSRHNQ